MRGVDNVVLWRWGGWRVSEMISMPILSLIEMIEGGCGGEVNTTVLL